MALLLCVCMVFGLTACGGFTQDDIDTTVNTAIAPVSEQITAINTSIDDLKAVDTELDGYIEALETKVTELEASDTATAEEITAIKAVIETLKTKDTELEGKITTLETYVNTELSDTEDWAEAAGSGARTRYHPEVHPRPRRFAGMAITKKAASKITLLPPTLCCFFLFRRGFLLSFTHRCGIMKENRRPVCNGRQIM